MTQNQKNNDWLLVSVSTAGGSASLRVYVWRFLRKLGATYLQQSVCVLPALPEVQKEVTRFAAKVRREGGSCRVLNFQITDDTERQQLIAEFNEARDVEYAEVLERTPSLLEELAMERERGNITYAEVEESEADLERFRSWIAKIKKRDYFTAPKGEEAHQAVAHCEQELASFEKTAFETENDKLKLIQASGVQEVLETMQKDMKL